MNLIRIFLIFVLYLIFSSGVKAEEAKKNRKEDRNVKVINTFVDKVFSDKKFQKKFKNLSFDDKAEKEKLKMYTGQEMGYKRQFSLAFVRYGITFKIDYNWWNGGFRIIVSSKSIDYNFTDENLDGKVNFGMVGKFFSINPKKRFCPADYDLEFRDYYQKKYNQILLVIKEILEE